MIDAKIETRLKDQDSQYRPSSKSISKEKAQNEVKPRLEKSTNRRRKTNNNETDPQSKPKEPKTPKKRIIKPRTKSAPKKQPNKNTVPSQNNQQTEAASKNNTQKRPKKIGRPRNSSRKNIKLQSNSTPKTSRRKVKLQMASVAPRKKLVKLSQKPLVTEISSDQQPETATNTQPIRGQLGIYQTSLPVEIPLPSKKVQTNIISKCIPNINYAPTLNKARRLSIEKKVVFESLSFFDPQAAERPVPKRSRKEHMRYDIRQQSEDDQEEYYTDNRRKRKHKIKKYRKILIEETDEDEEEQRYVIIKRPKHRPTKRDQPSEDKQPNPDNSVSRLLSELQPTE